MTDLVGEQQKVMEMLESRNMSLDWLSAVPDVSIDNAVNVISALFSANFTGLNETYVFRRKIIYIFIYSSFMTI